MEADSSKMIIISKLLEISYYLSVNKIILNNLPLHIVRSIRIPKVKSFYNNKGMNNLGWKQIMSIVRSLIDLGGAINKGNNWVCYELNKTIIRQQLN